MDEIERMAGLTFMPELGEPSAIEQSNAQTWLQTRFGAGSRDDERWATGNNALSRPRSR